MQASEKGLLLRVPFYCSFQGTVLLGVHFFFFFGGGGGRYFEIPFRVPYLEVHG